MSLTQLQSSSESPPTRRLTLPFLDTGPLTDVWLALLLLPLWWVLGVEQFVWPVLFGIAAIKVVYLQQMRVRVNATLQWFALFLVIVLISALFVDETMRMLTFIRNLGAFMASFLLLLVIANRVHSQESVERLLNAALIVMMITGVLGILAMSGIWRPSFQSLAGQLMPGSIAATSYGKVIASRALGQLNWFTGLGLYYRLRTFFMFSNHYSSALVYVLPFFFLKFSQVRGWKKPVVALGILILLVNLVYTTGRVAALSLIAGAIYYAVFHSPYRRSLRVLLTAGLTLAALAILSTLLLELTVAEPGQGLAGRALASLEAFTFARGEGSFISRFGVYEASLSGFLERPVFGWGTERDVVGLDIPAGSHSEYIAVLYRQGTFGIIAYVGLLAAAWRATRPPGGTEALSRQGSFLRYGRWFFVGALINNIMNDPSVDTTTYVLMWLMIGLLIATADQLKKKDADAARAG